MKNCKVTQNEHLFGFLFVLPAVIGIFIFIIIPIIGSFFLSFNEWNLLDNITFVGLKNYKAVLTEKYFVQIFINTVVYALSTTFFAVVIPLLIADILNKKIKLAEFFKTIFFIPFITPVVVIAIVWGQIFDPTSGFINQVFHTHSTWLFDKNLAMPLLVFISVWRLLGYNIILFLTGYVSINPNLYEAARIDGANNFQIFKKITLPLLKPTIYFVTLVTAISSFQVFDLVYIMTEGGPENSTNIIVYSIYKYAFEYFDIGKSCAMAYLLFIAILILAIIQRKLQKENSIE